MKKIAIFIGFLFSVLQTADAQWPPVWRYWRNTDGLSAPWCWSINHTPSGNYIVCHNNHTLSLIDGYSIQIIENLPMRGNAVVILDAKGCQWLDQCELIEDGMNKEEIQGFHRYNPTEKMELLPDTGRRYRYR